MPREIDDGSDLHEGAYALGTRHLIESGKWTREISLAPRKSHAFPFGGPLLLSYRRTAAVIKRSRSIDSINSSICTPRPMKNAPHRLPRLADSLRSF